MEAAVVSAATVDTQLDGTITNTFGALRAAQEQGWLLTSCVIGSGGAALDDLAPTTAPLLVSQDSGIDYDFALEGIEGHTTVARWKNLNNPEYQLLEAIEALQVGGKLTDVRYQHLAEGTFELRRRNEVLRDTIKQKEKEFKQKEKNLITSIASLRVTLEESEKRYTCMKCYYTFADPEDGNMEERYYNSDADSDASSDDEYEELWICGKCILNAKYSRFS